MSDFNDAYISELSVKLSEAETEIEWLRALIVGANNEKYLITVASLDRLREIERLKAALQEIAEVDPHTEPAVISGIAWAALGEGK